jgi:hypothetical protein
MSTVDGEVAVNALPKPKKVVVEEVIVEEKA